MQNIRFFASASMWLLLTMIILTLTACTRSEKLRTYDIAEVEWKLLSTDKSILYENGQYDIHDGHKVGEIGFIPTSIDDQSKKIFGVNGLKGVVSDYDFINMQEINPPIKLFEEIEDSEAIDAKLRFFHVLDRKVTTYVWVATYIVNREGSPYYRMVLCISTDAGKNLWRLSSDISPRIYTQCSRYCNVVAGQGYWTVMIPFKLFWCKGIIENWVEDDLCLSYGVILSMFTKDKDKRKHIYVSVGDDIGYADVIEISDGIQILFEYSINYYKSSLYIPLSISFDEEHDNLKAEFLSFSEYRTQVCTIDVCFLISYASISCEWLIEFDDYLKESVYSLVGPQIITQCLIKSEYDEDDYCRNIVKATMLVKSDDGIRILVVENEIFSIY